MRTLPHQTRTSKMKNIRQWVLITLGTLALVAVIFLVPYYGCSRPGKTREFLTPQGYTNIQTGGYSFFSCATTSGPKGQSDDSGTFRTNFEATSPAGYPVSGTYCCGVIRGCYIEWD